MKNEIAKENIEDMTYIRKKMKDIIDVLTDTSIDVGERRAMIGLYNTVTNSAKVAVSSVLASLALARFTADTEINQIEDEKDDNGRKAIADRKNTPKK